MATDYVTNVNLGYEHRRAIRDSSGHLCCKKILYDHGLHFSNVP